MGQELGLDGKAGMFSLSDCMADMGGLPENDDGGEQVKPGHAVALALAGLIADFTLAADTERDLKSVVSLALVQAGVGLRCILALSSSPVQDQWSFGHSNVVVSLSVRSCPLPESTLKWLNDLTFTATQHRLATRPLELLPTLTDSFTYHPPENT